MFRLLRHTRLLMLALVAVLSADPSASAVPPAPQSVIALRVSPSAGAGAGAITVSWVQAPCDSATGVRNADAVYSLYPDQEGSGPLTACDLLGGAAARRHV